MKSISTVRGFLVVLAIGLEFLAASEASAQGPASPFGSENGQGLGPQPAATSAPTASQAPPPELTSEQRAAAEILKTYNSSLAFVSGKGGSGNGFIVTMGGTNYLVTDDRVTVALNDAPFKGMDGTTVKGTPSAAVGEGVFRMEAPAGGKPFEVMQDVNQNAGVGDTVVVLGRAGADGSVTPILGKIAGIGRNLVEVDAPFDLSSCGSPIIHLKSGKVIGVATISVERSYEETPDKKASAPVIHRFACSLDSVKTWQPVNWQSYYAQAVMMQNIRTVTDDLDGYLRDILENGSITPDRHANSVLKNQIERSAGEKNPFNNGVSAIARCLSTLKMACQSDVNTAQRYMTYDCFQRELGSEVQTRAEMMKVFDRLLKAVPPDLFGGTKWEAGVGGDKSVVEFTPDGVWTEHWRDRVGIGSWKPTSDPHVIQVTRGPELNHDTIHYRLSDDGTTCTRVEDSLAYKKVKDPLAL